MAKTRLNMAARESIKNKLIARAFDHREKELMDRRPTLAKMIFDEIFPPAEQAKAEELPEGWLPYTTTVELRDAGGENFEGVEGT